MVLVKHHKAVVPSFLESRQSTLKRTFLLSAGSGAPMLGASYDKKNSLYIVDSESLQAETLSMESADEVASVQLAHGFIAMAQLNVLNLTFLGDGSTRIFRFDKPFRFFFYKSFLYIVAADKIIRVFLDANKRGASAVDEYLMGPGGELNGKVMLQNATVVQVENARQTGNVVFANKNSFQVWNFKKLLTNANGQLTAGKFICEGSVDGVFGFAVLRVAGNTIAAITESGDYIELWNIPDEPQLEPQASYKRIKQERMATALFLDEEYLIAGHIDGSLSVYDRVTGTRSMTVMNTTDLSLKNKARILFIDRVGEVLVTASVENIQVRWTQNLSYSLTLKKPNLKFEKIYFDTELKTIYALARSTVSESSSVAESCDLICWMPNYDDLLNSKKTDVCDCSTRVELYDVSPPVSTFSHKRLAKWSVMEVIYWLASLNIHEPRKDFFEGDVDGMRMQQLDDEGLQTLGVTAVGHRKRILIQAEAAAVVTPKPTEPSSEVKGRRSSTGTMHHSSSDKSISIAEKAPRRSPSFEKMDPTSPKKTKDSVASSKSSSGGRTASMDQAISMMRRKKQPSSPSESDSSTSETSIAPRGPKRTPSAERLLVDDDERRVQKITTLGAARIHIEFIVEDTGETVAFLVDSSKPIRLRKLLRHLLRELDREDMDPDADVALTVPSKHGAVPIFDQTQLDDYIANSISKDMRHILLNVSLGRMPASITSGGRHEPRPMKMQDVRKFLIFSKYPTLLVEPDTYNITSANALAQQNSGFSAAELLGKSFDNLLVADAAVSTSGLKAHLEQNKNVVGRIQWPSVLQKKDGTLTPQILMITPIPLIDGGKIIRVRIMDPSASEEGILYQFS